jgi:hypothetical protein
MSAHGHSLSNYTAVSYLYQQLKLMEKTFVTESSVDHAVDSKIQVT